MSLGNMQQDPEGGADLADVRRRFTMMLEESDRRGAQHLLRDTLAAGHRRSDLLKEVVSPAIEDISRTWVKHHELSLSQIYVAGLIVRDSVETLSPGLEPGQPSAGKVVIGVADGDHHGLGKLIVSAFLRSAGFEVIDLGLTVPAKTFVDTALAEGADIIAVSALMSAPLVRIGEIREEMVRRGVKGIVLIVGGAPFRQDPELYKTVGADATAPTAYEAIELARRLREARNGYR